MPQLIRQDQLLLRLIKEVNDIKSALRRTIANLPLYDISNENTPAQLLLATLNYNDYVIGNYDILRVSSDGTFVYLTGFAGGVKGRFIRLINVGSNEIAIRHQSALSQAQNRIVTRSGLVIVLSENEEMLFYYDSTQQRWIAGYNSSSDRISCDLRLNAAQSIPNAAYTAMSWDNIVKDTGGFFSVATPTYVNIPSSGWYEVTIQIAFDINGTGLRETIVTAAAGGNVMFDSRTAVTAASTNVTNSRQMWLQKGDIIRALVWQNSGGNLNVNVSGPGGSYTKIAVSKM